LRHCGASLPSAAGCASTYTSCRLVVRGLVLAYAKDDVFAQAVTSGAVATEMPIHAPFLKYFREVARSGSVRTAAKRLHVSSSAVNRQILKIESELNAKLFDRLPHGMQLTAAGRVLAEHVDRTLADADHTLTEIAELTGGGEKPVTIGGQESIIAAFLPPVLVRLHSVCPRVCTAFRAAGGNELNRLLLERTADVTIGFDVCEENGIEIVATRELAVGAIVGPGHPLADRNWVLLADCASFPLVLPDLSWPLRGLLDDKIADLDTELNVVTSSNSVEFLRGMIDQQIGVGFQTAVGIEAQLKKGELIHVPLSSPEPVIQRLSVCILPGVRQSSPFEQLLLLLQERLDSYADHWERCQIGTGETQIYATRSSVNGLA